MNDISLNWDRIHSYKGDNKKVAEDWPYTRAESIPLTENTTLRNRAILLLTPGLESYCTPECRKEIDLYLEWRKR
jgi:hypothetical protein